MASKRTKRARVFQIIFTILHFLCLLGPFLYFLPTVFIEGEVAEKVVIGLSTMLSLVFAAISIVVDVTHRAGLHRTILWVLILAVATTFSAVKTFICVMAIVSILDELIFTRLAAHFKNIKNTNKEIDKALNR